MNILIVKKDNIDDNELSDFFNLLKENNILIVEDVKNADLMFLLVEMGQFYH